MRIATLFIAATAYLALIPAYALDASAAFSACAVKKDDRVRLACYDKIRDDSIAELKKDQATATGYKRMSLTDLKVDLKEMIGRRVSFGAAIQVMGEMNMLKDGPVDMAPIWATTEKLPREDRKKLASGCQAVLCTGQFYGVVQRLPLGVGVMLEKVEW